MEKPKLEPGSVKRSVTQELEFTLGHDFERFSTGTLQMSICAVKFKSGEVSGEACVDVGGTKIEISMGERAWRISIESLIDAALKIDADYLKERS
jgi:hypothetical protein